MLSKFKTDAFLTEGFDSMIRKYIIQKIWKRATRAGKNSENSFSFSSECLVFLQKSVKKKKIYKNLSFLEKNPATGP